MTIDVPLLDVEEAAGPIQLWPGTHTLNYAKGFVHPNDARVCPLPPTEGSERRQYWHCYREMNELTRRLPSKLVVSQAERFEVRTVEGGGGKSGRAEIRLERGIDISSSL